MEKKVFNKVFKEHYHPFFREHGFLPRKSTCFRRKCNDLEQTIVFAPSKTKEGTICSSAGFNIYIPAIEKLWRPDEGFLTVGMPLHLLRPGREYYLWEFVTERDLIAGKNEILRDIKNFGLPFLDRFSDSSAVLDSLSSEAPSDWFMCSRDYRDALLVAFAYLIDGKTRSLEKAEALLQKYENEHPKYSKQLRLMHSTILKQ